MRARAFAAGLAALLPPGAAAAPPASLGLGVWPARTVLVGAAPQVVQVRNGGAHAVRIDLSAAGFALDPAGSPRLASTPGAARWLAIRPRSLRVPPGATRSFTVRPSVPRGARPGDHPALVLLRTRPPGGRTIGVRLRIGVQVDVRVPGTVHRRLAFRGLRVEARGRRFRRLIASVANLGDVTEAVRPSVSIELWRPGRLLARLRPAARELLPRSRGLVTFGYAGRVRGAVRVVATWRLRPGGQPTRKRAFRLRL